MAEDKPGSPERKCKTYNVIMAVINLLALTAALGIKSALYGAAFPSWPLVLADGVLFAFLPKFRVERDGRGSSGLSLGFGKRDFIKRAALIAVWLCACAAFIYGFKPNYTLAQAGDILRGEGYLNVCLAGAAIRDWESENPFVNYMPVFKAVREDGSVEHVSVSLETGGVTRCQLPAGGADSA